MSNILQFPNRRKTVFGPTGRLGREASANPFENPILRAIDRLQEAQDERNRSVFK